MSKVPLSVIVPIYNIAKYLEPCIESLLNQSFTDFEIILVNDGSSDNCPEICDALEEQDKRIKVIHKENEGLVSARKSGLEISRGKYIAFVDGDDWVDKYYLDILYSLAETNAADLVVTGQFREFDGKVETIRPKKSILYDEGSIRTHLLPNLIYNGNFCEHEISTYVWNKLFKRELLEAVLYDVPNDIIMGEDAAITYSYIAKCKKVLVSRIPLYYYRQRHNSILKSIEDYRAEYYRLGVLLNFLKIRLSEVLNEANLNKQLTYYLYSQLLIRSGGILINNETSFTFNPFENVIPGSKIVVYSSGSFGQHILSTNLKTNFFNIAAWIDVDFHDLKIGPNAVLPLSEVTKTDFDYLIIATVNPTTYESISKELIMLGVEHYKISKIKTNYNEIEQTLHNLGFDENFNYKRAKHFSLKN